MKEDVIHDRTEGRNLTVEVGSGELENETWKKKKKYCGIRASVVLELLGVES